MVPLIYEDAPSTWQDLEARVARILDECGYQVERNKTVGLARGEVTLDVWADDQASPPNVLVVECKHWERPATQTVVHAFRTVVGDSGANTGLLVSSTGFQSGAVKAAAYSNVRLLDWPQFQLMFADRWFRTHMCPVLGEATDPLHEYTEPINTRIFREADALAKPQQQHFRELRERHALLARLNFAFHPVVIDAQLSPYSSAPPRLPLRDPAWRSKDAELPADVLDAVALRPLMDALLRASERATTEFDQVFGKRA